MDPEGLVEGPPLLKLALPLTVGQLIHNHSVQHIFNTAAGEDAAASQSRLV